MSITNKDLIPNLTPINERIANIDKNVAEEVKNFMGEIDKNIERIKQRGEKSKAKAEAVRQALMNLDGSSIDFRVSCEWGTGANVYLPELKGRKDKKGLRPIDYAVMETRRAIGSKEFTESKELVTAEWDDHCGQIRITLIPKEPELSGMNFIYHVPKPPKGGKCRIVTTKQLVCEID